MSKIHFKRVVTETVAPLLAPLGYGFHKESQTVSNILFFEKPVSGEEDVKFFIDFQLGQHYIPPRRTFTVNLQRSRGSYSKPDREYKNTMTCRLAILIWAYYKLRFYPLPDHWWEFENDEELAEQLKDAMGKLLQYGIPWLEDPNAVPPWEFLKSH